LTVQSAMTGLNKYNMLPGNRPYGEYVALVPRFDPEMTDIIARFISHRAELAHARGAVVGISGGLDSAVVAALCRRALGKDKVLGLLMPDERPSPEARMAVKWLGIESRLAPIGGLVKALLHAGPKGLSRGAIGNLKARTRMAILYMEANQNGRLVVGTGNKSELLTGYFTKFGDGGADILPIGDLYKTQVRELAAALGVPDKIQKLVPTAGLYPGQTDEGELGMSYEYLDRILLGLELRLDRSEIANKTGVPLSEVERIARRVEAGAHKRAVPAIPKLGIRTIGLDWREEVVGD